MCTGALRNAKASGTFNMQHYLGGVFGGAVLSAVFAHNGNFYFARAFSKGFAVAIDASTALSIIAAIFGLWLPHAPPRQLIGAIARRRAYVAPAMSRCRADQA
jgi:hypothetical protein